MYYRYGDNPNNTWEVKEDENKVTAIYRGRVYNVREPIKDITHDERSYRLWKMFNLQDTKGGYDHMPDAIPLLFHMYYVGFGVVKKIRDTKYTFYPMPE